MNDTMAQRDKVLLAAITGAGASPNWLTSDMVDALLGGHGMLNIAVINIADVLVTQLKRGDGSVRLKGDGEPDAWPSAVVLTVQKQPGADTLVLDRKIDQALNQFEADLPPDVKLERHIFRQSDFIQSAVGNVEEAILHGAVWVFLILFIFLWNFSPSFGVPLEYYMVDALGITKIQLGLLASLGSGAAMLGALAFGRYATRLPIRRLLNVAIALGVAGTLAYYGLVGWWSAVALGVTVSFAAAIASLATLDLAARAVPQHAEGTFFAALMSVNNIGTTGAAWVGGQLYDQVGLGRELSRRHTCTPPWQLPVRFRFTPSPFVICHFITCHLAFRIISLISSSSVSCSKSSRSRFTSAPASISTLTISL